MRCDLVQIDIERSWMHWAKRLADTWESAPCDEILEQFLAIPGMEQYATFHPDGIQDSAFWREIAQTEMSSRSEWGDAIGPLHYKHHWDLSLSAREYRPVILARCIPQDAAPDCGPKTYPIRGNSYLGRQRSTQSDGERLSELPDGSHIAIAGREEARISRSHVQIQVLHPRFVVVSNNSKINAVGIPRSDTDLQPGKSVVVRVPFSLQFPGRIMQFDSA